MLFATNTTQAEVQMCKKATEYHTSIQQLLDHTEVGVGDAVVQRSVAIAICHISHMTLHQRGDAVRSAQEVPHGSSLCGLLTGHAEPLLLQRVQAGPLERKHTNTSSRAGHLNSNTARITGQAEATATPHNFTVAEKGFTYSVFTYPFLPMKHQHQERLRINLHPSASDCLERFFTCERGCSTKAMLMR